MCFSAEASVGVAAALLPVGGYCLAAAWRNNRAYLPLATGPLLFGLQQLCEGRVWDALDRGDPELARVPSLGFLFFALVVWPLWTPIAVAAIEPPGRKRWALGAFSGVGVLFGLVYYLPVATSGQGLQPVIVGHSIQYDFSAVALSLSAWWWIGPLLYLAAASGPLFVSHDRYVRPLGAAFAISGAVAYALFTYAFTSVWCFFASVMSLYLAVVMHQLPDRSRSMVEETPRHES